MDKVRGRNRCGPGMTTKPEPLDGIRIAPGPRDTRTMPGLCSDYRFRPAAHQ